MRKSNRPMYGIGKINRHTIRKSSHQRHPRLIRHQSVIPTQSSRTNRPFPIVLRRYQMNPISMYQSASDKPSHIHSKHSRYPPIILPYMFFCILCILSKIHTGINPLAYASHPCRKTMSKPSLLFQSRKSQINQFSQLIYS